MKLIFILFLFLSTIANSNCYAQNSTQKEWPDLPLLNIVTIDGVMPSYSIIKAPEGAVGVGITNNNHIPGRMVITLKGETLYDSGEYIKGKSGMKIKVRGNTTGAYLDQHPYKIKLSKKADLLFRNPKTYKHKDWALLSIYTWHPKMENSETNTATLFGLELARTMGINWEPKTQFVNVVLNDKYQGLYYLIETIDKGDSRVNIDDTGFIIENDAYWWNENGIYFKTNHQSNLQGYTYKYPDPDDINDSIENNIKNYMNLIEDKIWSEEDLEPYIDYPSFATWILTHDILATSDVVGSNMYYYKENYNINNIYATKLKMGPLWDFDSSFRGNEYTWTAYHDQNISYFPQLFKRKKFIETYQNIYKSIRPSIISHMKEYCQKIEDSYSSTFEESMKLHQTIYPAEGKNSLHSQLTELLTKLENRLTTIDKLMEIDFPTQIKTISDDQIRLLKRTNLSGQDYTNIEKEKLPKGIYINKYSNGAAKVWIK